MTSPRILTTAAAAALASVGTALAAESAPRFAEAPFLGRVSRGAGVRYDLDRTAARTVVTIDGRTPRRTEPGSTDAVGRFCPARNEE